MSGEVARIEFSPEQVSLIKRTICAGATDDELALFLGQCRRTGLDPFSRQIHAVKRWDNRQGREVMAIQVGIDGFRLVAERTGEADGQDGPAWCGEDGVWRDVWLGREPPAAAKVVVYRRGQSRGYAGIATWAEYAQRSKNGSLIGLWGKMPANMLAKCAESLALRKAFPAELSGLYSPEELPAAAPPETEHDREPETPPVRVLPPGSTPDDDARRRIAAAADLPALAAVWQSLPADLQKRVAADKDRRKAELTPAAPAVQPPPPKMPGGQPLPAAVEERYDPDEDDTHGDDDLEWEALDTRLGEVCEQAGTSPADAVRKHAAALGVGPKARPTDLGCEELRRLIALVENGGSLFAPGQSAKDAAAAVRH